MNPRDPLTLRIPRTLRETRRDPHDWWEGRREPEHCVIGFSAAMRPRRRASGLKPALRRLARAFLRWLRAPSPWERRP